MKYGTRSHLGAFALMIAVIIGTTRCGVRDDELLCEEAAAALEECCPGSAQRISCSYHPGCIDQSAIYPRLDPDVSECILSQECSDLRPQCGRIAAAVEHGDLPHCE